MEVPASPTKEDKKGPKKSGTPSKGTKTKNKENKTGGKKNKEGKGASKKEKKEQGPSGVSSSIPDNLMPSEEYEKDLETKI